MLTASNNADTGNETANMINSKPGPAKEVLVEGIIENKIKVIISTQ